MKIEIAGIYWPQANIGNFSCLFLLAYLRFSEVEFCKFYYQDKTIIVKNDFLKNSVHEKRPLEFYNESIDKHSYWGSSKFTKQDFLYYLTYSFAPSRLLCYGLKTRDFPLTGSFQLWKFIFELSIIEFQCDIFPFVLLNLWASYEVFKIRYWSKMEAKSGSHFMKTQQICIDGT